MRTGGFAGTRILAEFPPHQLTAVGSDDGAGAWVRVRVRARARVRVRVRVRAKVTAAW